MEFEAASIFAMLLIATGTVQTLFVQDTRIQATVDTIHSMLENSEKTINLHCDAGDGNIQPFNAYLMTFDANGNLVYDPININNIADQFENVSKDRISIVAGGFQQDIFKCTSILSLVEASLLKGYTVIIVDWLRAAGEECYALPFTGQSSDEKGLQDSIECYARSAGAVAPAARYFSKMLFQICQGAGIASANIGIFGYSLGAHFAAGTGREFKKLSSRREIGKIVGLDPAGPFFALLPVPSPCIQWHMRSSDAICTKTIHTNIGILGSPNVIAGFNAYVIGNGVIQPSSCGDRCNFNVPVEELFAKILDCIKCSHGVAGRVLIAIINGERIDGCYDPGCLIRVPLTLECKVPGIVNTRHIDPPTFSGKYLLC